MQCPPKESLHLLAMGFVLGVALTIPAYILGSNHGWLEGFKKNQEIADDARYNTGVVELDMNSHKSSAACVINGKIVCKCEPGTLNLDF